MDQIYEIETAISLNCKESENWAGMPNVSCAIIATLESIYNFGFVVQEETCMVCRAGRKPRAADVVEISIPGPLYLQDRAYSIKCTAFYTHEFFLK